MLLISLRSAGGFCFGIILLASAFGQNSDLRAMPSGSMLQFYSERGQPVCLHILKERPEWTALQASMFHFLYNSVDPSKPLVVGFGLIHELPALFSQLGTSSLLTKFMALYSNQIVETYRREDSASSPLGRVASRFASLATSPGKAALCVIGPDCLMLDPPIVAGHLFVSKTTRVKLPAGDNHSLASPEMMDPSHMIFVSSALAPDLRAVVALFHELSHVEVAELLRDWILKRSENPCAEESSRVSAYVRKTAEGWEIDSDFYFTLTEAQGYLANWQLEEFGRLHDPFRGTSSAMKPSIVHAELAIEYVLSRRKATNEFLKKEGIDAAVLFDWSVQIINELRACKR